MQQSRGSEIFVFVFLPPLDFMKKSTTKAERTEASPMKSLAEELDSARQTFRELLKHYGSRIEAALAQLRQMAVEQAADPKIPAAKMRDARDMISLLRRLEVNCEKGRRRDLKKMESLVEDLQRMVENW